MKTSLIRIVVITVLASCICSQASQITNASTAGPTHVQFEQRLVAFSRNDTDRLDVVFPISQFPFCRGALNRVRVRMVSEVNPLFLGGILLPNIAGVNAQFTCRFFLSAPGVSSAIR